MIKDQMLKVQLQCEHCQGSGVGLNLLTLQDVSGGCSRCDGTGKSVKQRERERIIDLALNSATGQQALSSPFLMHQSSTFFDEIAPWDNTVEEGLQNRASLLETTSPDNAYTITELQLPGWYGFWPTQDTSEYCDHQSEPLLTRCSIGSHDHGGTTGKVLFLGGGYMHIEQDIIDALMLKTAAMYDGIGKKLEMIDVDTPCEIADNERGYRDRCVKSPPFCEHCQGSGVGLDWQTFRDIPNGCTRCEGSGKKL